jgi:lysophospholipase L1-like esterase
MTGVLRTAVALALALVGAFTTTSHAMPHAKSSGRVWVIYPLGDSITVGRSGLSHKLPPSVNRTPGGYRSILDAFLIKQDIGHQFVGSSKLNDAPTLHERQQQWHEGHGGYRIEQETANLDGIAGGDTDNGGHWLTGTSEHPAIFPDVVIIHLGTNDIVQRFDPSQRYPTRDGNVNLRDAAQRAVFVNHMTARLKTLVDKIYQLRPNTRIVLSDIIPYGHVICDPITGAYRDHVRTLVGTERQAGHRIVFADPWKAFTYWTPSGALIHPGYLSNDTHHPTAAGYRAIARVFLAAVQRAIA